MTKKYKILFAILAAIATIQIVMAAPEVVPLDPSSSPVTDNEGGIRTFSARIMDAHFFDSNVSVYKNGTLVQYNASVPAGGRVDYTSIAIAGTWEINMTACNDSCSSYLWLWTVNDTTPPAVTIALPENRTYTNTSIPVNVSANETIGEWLYSLNGGANVSFAPNITITATEGANNITVWANDSAGNWNSSTVNFSVDTTPPSIVTGLGNSTYATTYIKWNWTNPTGDFNHTMVYLNSIHVANVSTEEYNATGLTANTLYELSTRTVDAVGNVNATWVNSTARTAPEPTPTATATAAPPSSSSGGGSSGGSSGGGAAPASTEKYENLGPQENHEEYVPKGAMAFKFNKQDLVSEVGFNSKTNEGLVTAKVENLKGRPTLVKVDAPGVVEKYFNVLLGTSGYGASTKIEDTYVIFSVPKAWLDENGVETIKLMKYKDGSWIDLKTEKIGEGKYKAWTLGFSSFAIVGVKPAEAVRAVATATPQATLSETPAPEATETPVAEHSSSLQNALIVLLAIGGATTAILLVALVRRRQTKLKS